MRLLVTGSTGVLGRAVLAAAAELGWEATPAVRRDPAPRELLLDLARPQTVASALEAARPEGVLHSAAVTDPAWAEAHPAETLRVNRDATALLAAECRRRGARLALVSTDLVFPGRPGGLYREEDEPAPGGVYARSKLEAEGAALAEHPRALVARTSLLLAPGRRGHVARLRAALAPDGPGATLFTDERRSPLLALDLARALLELLGMGASGLLHVAGPDPLSRHELGLLLARGLRLDASRIRPATRAAAPPPPRPGDVTLDSGRALALLGRTRLRRIADAGGELAP